MKRNNVTQMAVAARHGRPKSQAFGPLGPDGMLPPALVDAVQDVPSHQRHPSPPSGSRYQPGGKDELAPGGPEVKLMFDPVAPSAHIVICARPIHFGRKTGSRADRRERPRSDPDGLEIVATRPEASRTPNANYLPADQEDRIAVGRSIRNLMGGSALLSRDAP